GVATATKRVLALAPDLLPAMDLAAEIALELGDEPSAVRLWIRRLELRGQDPQAQARLGAASPASLTSADHVRWMRADPEGIGRQRFARALRAEGRSEQALSGLLAAGSASMPDEDRLLAARILLELDRAGQALRLLQDLPADSDLRARAVPLEIEGASRLGQHGRIETLLAQLETPLEHRAEDLLACAQRLLVAGRTAEARRILRHMDADPRLRSGEQILRLAQAALAEEDRAVAEDALARAEAFEEDGGPELGYIVLAAERRAWSELPWRVQDLRAASFEPSPVQRALLDALGERPDEAGRRIERGRAVDPMWSFLESVLPALSPPEEGSGGAARSSGTIAGDASLLGDGRRDPRPLLARVLALEHPDWTGWATAEMLRQAASGENAPWSTWLAARGLARLGETRRAEELLESLVQASPEFEPAWTQLAELVARRLRGSDDAQLARLQRRRLEALGGEPGDDTVDLLVSARAAAAAGDLDAALLAARGALERAPDDPEVILAVSRIYARRGDWRPAAHALRHLANVEPVSSRSARVAGALELLAQARTAVGDATFAEAVRSHLAAFAGRFTADPLAALALAEAELAAPGAGTVTALAIVFGRLDLFRERAGRPLDELRPGATAAWAAFYERYDPPRALELVRAELDRRPHSIDLWLLLGRALDSAGEREEAIRQYEAVRRMLPDPRASRALARLYSHTGRASEQVQAAIEEAVRLAQLPGPDAELRLDFARSLAYANPKTREQALGLVEELWSTRGGGAGGELVLEIGELYGTLLCWRGDPADRERARAVLREVETLARDPARRTLLRAMAGLARQIPERAEAEGG
ncbi:MAG TPA: tetratricopeptide repeat protein, partial [Planctomycetota bacterium]|nr:tetratricopeptide repeat protein [Planctomycetota bacterium]